MRAATGELRLSEIIAALSHALDITEGQPEGHAARTCLIGMRIAEEVGLPSETRSALFYALLLKDAGCSSNASRMSALFGSDERVAKRDVKLVDSASRFQNVRFSLSHAAVGRPRAERLRQFVALGRTGSGAAREMIATRCERGAEIARMLDLPELAAQAIAALDEHWDGRGQPMGLRGEEIPLLGRILGLAQTVEVFFSERGLEAAVRMAHARRGRWFDPELVRVLRLRVARDTPFWQSLRGEAALDQVTAFESHEQILTADDQRLDRIAEAFAKVVDAKSPYTFRHSERVAEITVGIAATLGFDRVALRDLRRAGLLHDIGKLGISNLILDKPSALTDGEFAEVKRHAEYGERILGRVEHFRPLAELAGAHHERLDGSGYYLGRTGDQLSREARVLAVADVYEALTAERPYRPAMEQETALGIMRRDVGSKLCPEAFEGLERLLGVVRESVAA